MQSSNSDCQVGQLQSHFSLWSIFSLTITPISKPAVLSWIICVIKRTVQIRALCWGHFAKFLAVCAALKGASAFFCMPLVAQVWSNVCASCLLCRVKMDQMWKGDINYESTDSSFQCFAWELVVLQLNVSHVLLCILSKEHELGKTEVSD